MKTKMVEVSIYPALVFVTTDRAEFERIRAKYTDKKGPDLEGADGIAHHDGCGHFVVGVFDENLGTLVHELAHLTFRILRYCRVKADHKNQEAFAYLQQWLFDQFHELITKGA